MEIEITYAVDLSDYEDEVIEYCNNHISFDRFDDDMKSEAADWVTAHRDPPDVFSEQELLDWVINNVDHDEILERLEQELKPE